MLKDFLNNRKQRVVLNGKSSDWLTVSAGVPQSSVLGPLFFLIYINDLVENVSCDIRLFAADTSLFSVVYDVANTALKLKCYSGVSNRRGGGNRRGGVHSGQFSIEGGVLIEGGCSRQPVFNRRGVFTPTSFQ